MWRGVAFLGAWWWCCGAVRCMTGASKGPEAVVRGGIGIAGMGGQGLGLLRELPRMGVGCRCISSL